MAKQTLDLFKLFKLVVDKGGLVEVSIDNFFSEFRDAVSPVLLQKDFMVSFFFLFQVINKKIWREIIKGLSLPASVTSAAFTLRTQ